MKKALSIVLAVCMLAGLCVGLSLTSASAAVTLPAKPAGAKNYVNLETINKWQNNAAKLPTVDAAAGTIELKGSDNGQARVGDDLVGLTATDDFVVSMSIAGMQNWHSYTWGLTVGLDYAPPAEEGLPGNGTRIQKFLLSGNANVSDFCGDEAGVAMAKLTSPASSNVNIYVDYNEDTAKRDVHFFNGTTYVQSFEGVAALDPKLFIAGASGGSANFTVSNLFVYKVEAAAETTTTTTTTTVAGGDETTTTVGGGDTTTTTKKPTGIVDGVDLDKKGSGKDVEVLAPGDTTGKNLVNLNKVDMSKGGKIDGNAIHVGSGITATVDLSGLKASDDFIIKFKYASPSWWPHEGLNITFGQGAADTDQHTLFLGGNARPNGAATDNSTAFEGSNTTPLDIPVASYPAENEYVIYVTTSRETGLRRIYFFVNNKLFLADGQTKDAWIEGEKVLTPCLILTGTAATDDATNPRWNIVKDLEVYVAAAPKFKEKLEDKAYTTPPIASKDAKNYADLSKATAKGNAAVDAEKGVFKTGNNSAEGSVTIPLTGLKKTDSYVISFMTTMCSYDAWQGIGVTFGKTGDVADKVTLRAADGSYHEVALGTKKTELVASAKKNELTKVDIMVSTSVETGKRRVIVFQDGKICTIRNTTNVFDSKSSDLLDPALIFNGGGNFSFEVTNLKVYKINDKGGSNNANTGNASTAVAALAVTAAVALPVIFVAKKKRKEEE